MWKDVPVRRRDRALDEAAAMAILQQGEYGVLATADAAGLPLATPLNYVMLDGALYFHCAMSGHKLDNLAARPQVAFCVVGATQPLYDGNFTTNYESALVFGEARLVDGAEEKQRALMALAEKYLPDHMDKAPEDIAASLAHTAVVRVQVQRVSGKARRTKPQN